MSYQTVAEWVALEQRVKSRYFKIRQLITSLVGNKYVGAPEGLEDATSPFVTVRALTNPEKNAIKQAIADTVNENIADEQIAIAP